MTAAKAVRRTEKIVDEVTDVIRLADHIDDAADLTKAGTNAIGAVTDTTRATTNVADAASDSARVSGNVTEAATDVTKARDQAATAAKTTENVGDAADAPQLVYRGGSKEPMNMTPRPVKDPEGLTAWNTPEAAVAASPSSNKIQVVDTSKLNNVKAIPDASSPGHVSLTPGTAEELAEWAVTRGTDVVHPNTQELIDAVVDTIRVLKA